MSDDDDLRAPAALHMQVQEEVCPWTIAGWLWNCDEHDTHGNADSEDEAHFVALAHVEFVDDECDVIVWQRVGHERLEGTEASVKAVLDAHQFNGGGSGRDASCYAEDCGWTHPWDRPTHEMWDAHRAHLAELIAR